MTHIERDPEHVPLGPAVGYRLEPCPDCGRECCITWQGYRVEWPAVDHADHGDCALMVTPGGQVLLAGSGNPADNRYRLHDHQPPELAE